MFSLSVGNRLVHFRKMFVPTYESNVISWEKYQSRRIFSWENSFLSMKIHVLVTKRFSFKQTDVRVQNELNALKKLSNRWNVKGYLVFFLVKIHALFGSFNSLTFLVNKTYEKQHFLITRLHLHQFSWAQSWFFTCIKPVFPMISQFSFSVHGMLI